MTGAATDATQTSVMLNGTVNPNGINITSCNFDVAGGSPIPCMTLPGSGTGAVTVSAPLTGQHPDAEGEFRLVAENSEGTIDTGAWRKYKALPNAPSVSTEPALETTATTATLNARINPKGGEVTSCLFEYGTSPSYGLTVPCSQAPGPGENAVPVSGAVTGLKPNAEYHFRIVATNAGGTTYGQDQQFETLPGPPTLETGSASGITPSSAVLGATVDPNDAVVSSCRFEYGTTEGYGSSVPCSSLPPTSGSPVPVSAALGGLNPATTYHFRITATNTDGTVYGSDANFETLPTPLTDVLSFSATNLLPAQPTGPATSSVSGSRMRKRGLVVSRGTGLATLEYVFPQAGRVEAFGQVLDSAHSQACVSHGGKREKCTDKPALRYGRVTLAITATGSDQLRIKPSKGLLATLRQGKAVTVRLTVIFTPSGGTKAISEQTTVKIAPRRGK
jgi:hypothetical protein